jgi:hypothetical protein
VTPQSQNTWTEKAVERVAIRLHKIVAPLNGSRPDWDRVAGPIRNAWREEARSLLKALDPRLPQQPSETGLVEALDNLCEAAERINYSGEIGDVEDFETARDEAVALLSKHRASTGGEK